ncbi:MAG: ribosome biogenesis GTPase Der [Helicobacteraceae bacterium]|jgi:GTP-binding protein|nr:ribosome biogenesis GTPase Der [Helicobacteraceae bacterium]
MFRVAIIGRPNAGKSALFNRLIKSREAIESDAAGTTRDIKIARAVIGGFEVEIMDTGGLEDRGEIFALVRKKALEAAKNADLILFLVDGQLPPSDEDRRLFYESQKLNPSIVLVLNKIDNDALESRRYEYMSFGAKELYTISCSHKRGFDELGRRAGEIIRACGKAIAASVGDGALALGGEAIRAAIIGRPNVGKSALLNALVGFDRSVVSRVAGTTVDPVDERITIGDREIVFVDTAGVRKRSRIEGIERFAFDRTEKALAVADVALITLDASEEFSELDERIAGLADKHKTAAILVLNKYDIARAEYKILEKEVRDRFVFLSYAPIITLSALSKKRVNKLGDLIINVHENYSRRVPTARLNEIINEALSRHPLPSDRGKTVKIYYAAQHEVKPPKIALISNRPRSIHFSYLRYLTNKLRQNANFEGSPIIIETKSKRKEARLKQ